MSKMMDNLARVRDEEQAAPAEKKPSLFVVREQPVGSASGGAGGQARRKVMIVWSVAATLVAGLGAHFFLGQNKTASQISTAQRVQPAQDPGVGDSVALIRSGQLGEAKNVLDRQLHAQPGNAAVLVNRAYVLKELGQAAEAEATLRVVATSRPNDPLVLNNLGALLLRAGRAAEAEAVLRKAVELDPKGFEARVNLAGALELRREWAGALRIFEEILAGGDQGPRTALIRERVRRLRSLAASTLTPKEKL